MSQPYKHNDPRLDVEIVGYIHQMAEASKALMECARLQTISQNKTERLTQQMKTLTWVIGVLTFLSFITVAFQVLNSVFHWIN